MTPLAWLHSLSLGVIINNTLLLLLCLSVFAILYTRDLIASTIYLGIFSFLMAMLYLMLGAPDVAITEAAVGAGISTILLLMVLLVTGKEEKSPHCQRFISFVIVAVIGGMLVYAITGMPLFGDPMAPIHQHVVPDYMRYTYEDMGITNIVTGILASYRGFDTLGEVFVIFTAGISLLLLLSPDTPKKGEKH